MRILSNHSFVIRTSKSIEAIVQEFEKNIKPEKLRFWSDCNEQKFEGKLEGKYFRVKKMIWGVNHFAPRINGKIHQGGECTSIQVTMKLPTLYYLFDLFWFGGLLAAQVFLYYVAYQGDEVHPLGYCIPLLLIFTSCRTSSKSFWNEVKVSKKALFCLVKNA